MTVDDSTKNLTEWAEGAKEETAGISLKAKKKLYWWCYKRTKLQADMSIQQDDEDGRRKDTGEEHQGGEPQNFTIKIANDTSHHASKGKTGRW